MLDPDWILRTETLAEMVVPISRKHPASQELRVICMAEEVGEAVEAWRIWSGNHRRSQHCVIGNAIAREDLGDEIADVIITAAMLAAKCGIDVDEALERKVRKVLER